MIVSTPFQTRGESFVDMIGSVVPAKMAAANFSALPGKQNDSTIEQTCPCSRLRARPLITLPEMSNPLLSFMSSVMSPMVANNAAEDAQTGASNEKQESNDTNPTGGDISSDEEGPGQPTFAPPATNVQKSIANPTIDDSIAMESRRVSLSSSAVKASKDDQQLKDAVTKDGNDDDQSPPTETKHAPNAKSPSQKSKPISVKKKMDTGNDKPKRATKSKRLSPLEKAQATALEASQRVIDLAEKDHKYQCEQTKAKIKECKVLEGQLAQMQAQISKLRTSIEAQQAVQTEAQKAKVAARKAHKQLQQHFARAMKAMETVQESAKAATVKLKQTKMNLKRSRDDDSSDDDLGDLNTKKQPPKKKKGEQGGKKKSIKVREQYDDSDDSSDNDSDWEGIAGKTKTPSKKSSAASSSPTSAVRSSARQQRPWNCPACTLENKGSSHKCSICMTAKPGTSYVVEGSDADESDSEEE